MWLTHVTNCYKDFSKYKYLYCFSLLLEIKIQMIRFPLLNLSGLSIPTNLLLVVVAVVQSLSCVQFLEIPCSVAHQAPPTMGLSRQEYWSGLSFLSPNFLLTHS